MTDQTHALGAVRTKKGVSFRVWAPGHDAVELVLQSKDGKQKVQPERGGDGYWTYLDPGPHGDEFRYGYIVDGTGPLPDPCSRAQPDGVDALSALAPNPPRRKRGKPWKAPDFEELVVYEMHLGTFTEGGTFQDAIPELERLAGIGINAVEVMPIASFAGRWNWGYDGVALWAPFEGYGGPLGLQAFVEAAHRCGIAVILDVVYNHFGPEGSYTAEYSSQYLLPDRLTPWGPAMNFDGDGSSEVRQFFIQNALHWLGEYGIDGLRLDATHAIIDGSPIHFLAELSQTLRSFRPDAPVYLIAETAENDPRYVRSTAEGGFGFDAVWADDFHHACRTAVEGDYEGYYRGFNGLRSLSRIVERGWLFEGQFDPGSEEPRGYPADFDRWSSAVFCVQNHDQVGNRAFGDRLSRTASGGTMRALTTLLLVHPATPMLFQGQEFNSARPFLFFTDHKADLAGDVSDGRREEFARFSAFSDQHLRECIPDPQAETSFRLSKLEPVDERDVWSGLMEDYHRELLSLRCNDPVLRYLRSHKGGLDSSVRGDFLRLDLASSRSTRSLLMNLGRRTKSIPIAKGDRVLVNSDEPRWGGLGRPVKSASGEHWLVSGETALLLSTKRVTPKNTATG